MAKPANELDEVRVVIFKVATAMPPMFREILQIVEKLLPETPALGEKPYDHIAGKMDDHLKNAYEANALNKSGPAKNVDDDNQSTPPKPF